jgi:putative ABC transport system permease protein
VRIGEERFRVIGVLAPRGLSLGMDFDEVVHLPVRRALRLFDRTSLFRILVEAGSHEELASLSPPVLAVLKERHSGEDDVTVLTQDAVVATFGRILTILTAVVAGIAAISLAVAGIGIMNVMLVSVSERTREIGLLKALGVSSRQVVTVFLAEASLLSSLGGALGLAAGLGAARFVRTLYPAFPAEPPAWAVAAAALLSIAVGMLFGALPARRAARLDPVAALARR